MGDSMRRERLKEAARRRSGRTENLALFIEEETAVFVFDGLRRTVVMVLMRRRVMVWWKGAVEGRRGGKGRTTMRRWVVVLKRRSALHTDPNDD